VGIFNAVLEAFASLFGAIRAPTPSSHKTAPLFDIERLLTHPRVENEAHIRSLCENAYLGDETALCRVLGRYKMFVDTTDQSLSPHLMLDGYWEMWLTEALAQVIRPGMTVVDVGANLGYFTLLMADRVGEKGRVIAFEPNPSIVARLRRTLSLNGFAERTTVNDAALFDENDAEVLLISPVGEPKNAHLTSIAGLSAGPNIHPLRTRRLDSFPDVVKADVIKIDADTAEEAIWRGMHGLFASQRPMTVFLEFAAARYADAGQFLAEIKTAGFIISRLDPKRGVEAVEEKSILSAPPHVDQMLVLRR
jgi:FkbM family methyltransferase